MKSAPIGGLIVTHGRLGQELVNSSRKITGVRAGVKVLSNLGLSNQELARQIVAELESHGGNRCLIFTDLPAGSCYIAARYAVREVPGHTIITGINLPMLLDFLTKRDSLGYKELAERLLVIGIKSQTLAPQ